MSTQPSEHRGPEQLQREADAIRADLDRTLDALQRKLSPRRVANRSYDFVRQNGADMLRKASATAAKHPVPVLLASAGLLWLVSSKRKRSERERVANSMTDSRTAFDRSTERARSTIDGVRDRTLNSGTQIGRMIRKRPLVYGTMAAAVGAAVGAAVPASRYERDAIARARLSAGPLLRRAAYALQYYAKLRREKAL